MLVEAVRQEVITPGAAELITVTRLHGVTLADHARQCGLPVERLTKQRQRAEAKLIAAIAEGHVCVTHLGPVSDPGR